MASLHGFDHPGGDKLLQWHNSLQAESGAWLKDRFLCVDPQHGRNHGRFPEYLRSSWEFFTALKS